MPDQISHQRPRSGMFRDDYLSPVSYLAEGMRVSMGKSTGPLRSRFEKLISDGKGLDQLPRGLSRMFVSSGRSLKRDEIKILVSQKNGRR